MSNFVVYDMSLTQIIQTYNLNLPDTIVGTQPANSLVIYNLLTVNGVNALEISSSAFGIPVVYA